MRSGIILTSVIVLMAFTRAVAKTPKGHLVIIGGGGITPAIKQAMVNLANGILVEGCTYRVKT